MGKGLSTFFKLATSAVSRQIVRNKSHCLHTRLPITVKKDKLSSIETWPSKNQYELMFATKSGLPIPHFPITHSAIALANSQNGTYAVYGRQSPMDFTMWLKKGILINTRKDNELPYLNDNYEFTLYPTGVSFRKSEIDYFLNAADKAINQLQSCNMVSSNCYSYSVTAMTFALHCLIERPTFDYAKVRQIISVMKEHPLNDHSSFGVFNNSTVVDLLLSVLYSIKNKVNALSDVSDDASELLHETSKLIETIEIETGKSRLETLLSNFISPK